MWYVIYRVSDQQILRGASSPQDFDQQTEALQAYPEHLRPDRRTERFDDTAPTKKRVATTQEIAEFDNDRQALIEQARFDDEKMLKAVAIYFAQQAGIPLATARAGILQVYRGL